MTINLKNSVNGIMKFELIYKNYTTFKDLCDRMLFNPVIQSLVFDNENRIFVNLGKSKLAEFAILIKDLDVEIFDLTAIERLK